MSTRSTITTTAGMMCLFAVCFSVYCMSPAGAQAPERKVRWEYKAVSFYADRGDDHTEQLSKLASEGWEYAGLLIPPYDSNQRFATRSVVAFRRMK